jgi:hypothetical protein
VLLPDQTSTTTGEHARAHCRPQIPLFYLAHANACFLLCAHVIVCVAKTLADPEGLLVVHPDDDLLLLRLDIVAGEGDWRASTSMILLLDLLRHG